MTGRSEEGTRRRMRAEVLTLAMTAVLAFAAPHPASTAPKRLPAQLGFIVFCRTSMMDVTARLGPGTLVVEYPDQGLARLVRRR
jgi:hypothetical protein